MADLSKPLQNISAIIRKVDARSCPKTLVIISEILKVNELGDIDKIGEGCSFKIHD